MIKHRCSAIERKGVQSIQHHEKKFLLAHWKTTVGFSIELSINNKMTESSPQNISEKIYLLYVI